MTHTVRFSFLCYSDMSILHVNLIGIVMLEVFPFIEPFKLMVFIEEVVSCSIETRSWDKLLLVAIRSHPVEEISLFKYHGNMYNINSIHILSNSCSLLVLRFTLKWNLEWKKNSMKEPMSCPVRFYHTWISLSNIIPFIRFFPCWQIAELSSVGL